MSCIVPPREWHPGPSDQITRLLNTLFKLAIFEAEPRICDFCANRSAAPDCYGCWQLTMTDERLLLHARCFRRDHGERP